MFKHIIMLFFSQGINFLIPIILVPYLVRVLGPTYYGNFNLAVTIILYGALFVDFGFNLFSSAKVAKTTDKHEISKIFTLTICSKLLLFLPVLMAIITIINSIPKFADIKMIVYILSIQLFASVFSTIWLYQGLEKINIFSAINIVVKISTLPAILLFVRSTSDLLYLALIQAMSFIITNSILIRLSYKYGIYFTRISFSAIKKYITSSSHIFVGTVSVSLYTLSTPIILGVMSSGYEVGLFSATDKIRGAFISIFLILSNVIYPRIHKLKGTSEKSALLFIKKVASLQLIGGLLIMVGLIFLSPFIINVYLGPKFHTSILLLQLMSPMIVLIPMSVLLANYLLLSWNHRKEYTISPIITATVHIIYALPLCYFFGAIGAAVSILVTECISFILLLYFSYRKGLLSRLYSV